MTRYSKLADTDLCVMCGMCLPHCPTYQLYQSEAESPRGRIALMQAIDHNNIKNDPAALLYIDHCLGCLNCETICPSGVPFGKLIDEFRDQLNPSIKKNIISRLILRQSKKPDGIDKLAAIASHPALKPVLGLATGLTKITPLPPSSGKLNELYPALASRLGQVTLFTGCGGKSTDSESILSATQVLNRLGFDVHLPRQEFCCGALHQHNGQLSAATELLQHNTSRFTQINSQTDSQAILFFSPACGSQLLKIPDLPIEDARLFIFSQIKKQALLLSPLPQAVALHESCSQQNMLKSKSPNLKLLQCIPDIQITLSSQPSICCGAGGLQAFNYPEQAQALLQKKLSTFDWSKTNTLISDNIGCSLHIKSAISAYNPQVEVLHPISLLARQLPPP
ncbi:Glycolate dehydrogenase, iron-sulfur subunit GlcF [hydrothermal vent metagenome]|uniref:Glycolate dehydrogenase, iron-sulfur subunit GlcF n=1 Tax=hydrothermal vent metagenome TaxID=652676 RepID=A0A3B0Y3A6_9ZZZZ